MNDLHIDSVLKSYGSRPILTDIYLGCKTGEVVGLLGRNGSGKTTLLKIVFGSLKAEYRHVEVGGKVLYGIPDGSRFIKYVPQDSFLPDHIKIKNMIGLFCGPRAEELIAEHPFVGPFLKRKSGGLSGGERRIFEILLTIYSDARYILIDEPFNGIAPNQVEEIKKIIRKHARSGKGFIITDHSYRNVLDIADRVVLIHEGAMRSIGHESDLQKWDTFRNGN